MTYKHFQLSEFDSPGSPGSGKNMKPEFLQKLDEARGIARIPFRITSGYRTAEYHRLLMQKNRHAAKFSPHLDGYAADIATPTSSARYQILSALIKVGFNRFGIGETFIHVDNHPERVPNLMWHYYD